MREATKERTQVGTNTKEKRENSDLTLPKDVNLESEFLCPVFIWSCEKEIWDPSNRRRWPIVNKLFLGRCG